MKDEHFDVVAKLIISSVANSLPPDSHLKVVHSHGDTWFFFRVSSEHGGLIRGCFNPFEGIRAWVRRFLNGSEEQEETLRQFVVPCGESLLRELLADLSFDAADFVHLILNKANHKSMLKESQRLARELRQLDDPDELPEELLEKLQELLEHTAPMRALGKWFIDLQLARDRVTSGRKSSRLLRWEVLEAKKEYSESLIRFQGIKRHHNAEKKNFAKTSGNVNRFSERKWKLAWAKICEECLDYHDLPMNILAQFTHNPPAEIAAEYVSRKFGIPLTSFKLRILPQATKL